MQVLKILFALLLAVGLSGPTAQPFEIMLPAVYEDGIEVSNWLMS